MFAKHNEYAYIVFMSNIYIYVYIYTYIYIYIYIYISMYVYVPLMKVNYDDIVTVMKFSSVDSILV